MSPCPSEHRSRTRCPSPSFQLAPRPCLREAARLSPRQTVCCACRFLLFQIVWHDPSPFGRSYAAPVPPQLSVKTGDGPDVIDKYLFGDVQRRLSSSISPDQVIARGTPEMLSQVRRDLGPECFRGVIERLRPLQR